MVGEIFEIYNLQMTRNAFLSAKIYQLTNNNVPDLPRLIPDIHALWPPCEYKCVQMTRNTQTKFTIL